MRKSIYRVLIIVFFSFILSEEVIKYSKLPAIGKNDFKIFYGDNKDGDKEILDKVEYVDFNSLYSDGPLLVSFWFLGCVPCVAEMKHLTKFNEKYEDTGFKVISINTDTRNKAKVKSFVKKRKYSFDMLFDLKGKDGLLKRLGGNSCPFTALINADGTIFSKHIGYERGDEIGLEKKIAELIDYDKTLQSSKSKENEKDKGTDIPVIEPESKKDIIINTE